MFTCKPNFVLDTRGHMSLTFANSRKDCPTLLKDEFRLNGGRSQIARDAVRSLSW